MPALVVGLGVLALLVAWTATGVVTRVGRRLRAMDDAGVAGQVKAPPRRVPNTGGVGIFAGLATPLVAAALFVLAVERDEPGGQAYENKPTPVPAAMHEHMEGLRGSLGELWWLLGALGLLHVVGLIDDRRPLGPWLKLGCMLLPAVAVPLLTDTRLLVLLDDYPGGQAVSVGITALWLLAMTNALNFLDNMDGLSGGVSAIAGAFLTAAMLLAEQWFVAGMSACVLGACLGFLPHNFPSARVFMGDGGSLVLGFALGFLSVRGTYVDAQSGNWYAVLLPVLVLAVPLYDLASVVTLRLAQGKSPLVGDLQHVSHRLAGRGLGRRGAVLVLWAFAGIAGASGLLLMMVGATGAVLIGVQAVVLMAVLAFLEFGGGR